MARAREPSPPRTDQSRYFIMGSAFGTGKAGNTAAPSTNGAAHLLPQHFLDLAASGLAESTIARAGIYSEANGEKIRGLLNWTGKSKHDFGDCIVIPYFDATGARTGYSRLKPDNPRVDGTDGKKFKYESPYRLGN